MSDANTENDIYALQAKIASLASEIKEMKKTGQNSEGLTAKINELVELRAKLTELNKENNANSNFNRKAFDELLLRKMYVVPSFEIHNGPAGLFDYGPPACALKANVLQLWRRHFVLEENMLEMECTNLTPSSVLEASGHVDRFTDFMVRDEVTGECFRADKLLEEAVDKFLAVNNSLTPEEQEEHRRIQRQADAFTAEELHAMLQKYNVKSPSNPNNNLTKPFPFNLMFKTTIGPEGTSVGYLRPETAQGLFVNFRRLLDYNQQKMPFAAAQIGLGFRNEIAPRNGLLRVREFCMAEIEHFVNPNDKKHPKFATVADKQLVLFPNDAQLTTGRTVVMTAGEAVAQGIINNETLAYFMARTQLFLEKIGVDPQRMRFRQHLKTEMAHYAADCWDMEIQMSYGWIECVGHADRACYDLEQHSKKTGAIMMASERLSEAVYEERLIAEPNKKLLGPRFKGDQKQVTQLIEALSDAEAREFQAKLQSEGKVLLAEKYEITAELVSFQQEKKLVVERKYTPSVIEPSFGVGRILYAVMEHAFSQRSSSEQRCVMSLKPVVAPVKVGIFRLINHTPFDPIVEKLRTLFLDANISNRVDSSAGTVGRRYSRSDELGIPFGVTVDFQTLIDQTVTLRDRDSMAQVRVSIASVVQLVRQLVEEQVSWAHVMQRYVVVKAGGDDENDEEENASDSNTNNAASANSSAPVVVEFNTRGSFSRPNPSSQTK